MVTIVLALIAVALIVVGAIAFLRTQAPAAGDLGAYLRDERRWMPGEIAGAELLHSERQLYATLNGATIPVRPDQVYRTRGNEIVPVDSKTRAMAMTFEADEIELSLQRLALAESHVHSGRGTVAAHGYIRIKPKAGNRRPSYHRVQLWTRERLERLHERYLDVVSGRITPTSQKNRKACAGCAYRSRCPRAL